MHWETKNFVWLALLWYLLNCGGLEPSLPQLRGLPVCLLPCPTPDRGTEGLHLPAVSASQRALQSPGPDSAILSVASTRPGLCLPSFVVRNSCLWTAGQGIGFTLVGFIVFCECLSGAEEAWLSVDFVFFFYSASSLDCLVLNSPARSLSFPW